MFEMPTNVRENDLLIYANLTTSSGPAMTWGMFATGWLELGNLTMVNQFFNRSYANIQPPFDVWTETPTGGAVNFITGAGGFLQEIIYGLSGLRIHSNELLLNPMLPDIISNVTIQNFYYLGNELTLSFDSTTFSLCVSLSNGPQLYISINNATVPLSSKPQLFTITPASIHT